jgi:pyrroline-5-carboxylate reductase
MGAAIMAGALRAMPEARIVALDPDLERARSLLPPHAPVRLTADPGEAAALKPDLVVIAVKPQSFFVLEPALMDILHVATCVSIMAGIPLNRLSQKIGHSAIIRVMPNLPAMVGQGMSVGCRAAGATPESAALVASVFGSIGQFDWVENESVLELAMPVFACGPGFLFAIAQHFTDAAVAAGLPASLADRLVRQTFLGSADLLAKDRRSAADLKQAVSSPGGTTLAGLGVLEGPQGLASLIPGTLDAAHRRALELAKLG